MNFWVKIGIAIVTDRACVGLKTAGAGLKTVSKLITRNNNLRKYLYEIQLNFTYCDFIFYIYIYIDFIV